MPSHFQSPQRIARLMPLDDLLARVDALVQPVARRNIKLAAALDRTLARDVVITESLPNAALALRDGWALRSDLTTRRMRLRQFPAPNGSMPER
jgi:molybdopterin biosynthesis enzyme